MTTTTTPSGLSFLDAETAGGDELRALPATELAALLADCLEAAAAERATFPGRTGRDLKASQRLVARAEDIARRLYYYLGEALQEDDPRCGEGPFGDICDRRLIGGACPVHGAVG
jgi:hypothetical protein